MPASSDDRTAVVGLGCQERTGASNAAGGDGCAARRVVARPLIMGVDPGTRVTGYALLRAAGGRFDLVDSGSIRLDPKAELPARLAVLAERLEELMRQHEPRVVAVEDIFQHRNARSALSLGHARGVALATAARRGAVVEAYPPATVKRAVGGHGRAEKRQVQQMVRALLGLQRTPAQDEADAIAVAICHALSQRTASLARPGGGGRR